MYNYHYKSFLFTILLKYQQKYLMFLEQDSLNLQLRNYDSLQC